MSQRSDGGSSPERRTQPAAVVVAGGAGRRMGTEVAKQYLEVHDRPVLHYALAPFLEHPGIGRVVVVLPPADVGSPPLWLRRLDLTIVPGGPQRSDSVWNGLRALPDDADPVLIHDGARPFITRELIDRVLASAREGGAVAAIPVADTIKEVDASGRIVATPDRARLWQAQTPQGFPRSIIIEAHRHARQQGIRSTDDAVLVENLGVPVVVVEGSAENLKITRPADLVLAAALAARFYGG
jgi:2-C-methyl-D-erythritol 4-phosphate cytidylyltransferase